MNPIFRSTLVNEILARADSYYRERQYDQAWKTLADAHIVSQPDYRLHFVVHWKMLLLALRQRDLHETWGQALRLLVAAPGSLSGRYPKGNTGRSDVSMFQPMPIRKDLEAKLEELRS